RAGQCVSTRIETAVGPGDGGELCGGAHNLSLVHAAVASGYARQARAIHQAGGSGVRLRVRDDAGATVAARGERARRGARVDSQGPESPGLRYSEALGSCATSQGLGVPRPWASFHTPYLDGIVGATAGGEPLAVGAEGEGDDDSGIVAFRMG